MPLYNPGKGGLTYTPVLLQTYVGNILGPAGFPPTFDFSAYAATAFLGKTPVFLVVRLTLLTINGVAPSAGLTQVEVACGNLTSPSNATFQASSLLQQTFYTPLAAPANGPTLYFTLTGATGYGYTTPLGSAIAVMPYALTFELFSSGNAAGYYLDPFQSAGSVTDLVGFWS